MIQIFKEGRKERDRIFVVVSPLHFTPKRLSSAKRYLTRTLSEGHLQRLVARPLGKILKNSRSVSDRKFYEEKLCSKQIISIFQYLRSYEAKTTFLVAPSPVGGGGGQFLLDV